jgi:hypothetical protein
MLEYPVRVDGKNTYLNHGSGKLKTGERNYLRYSTLRSPRILSNCHEYYRRLDQGHRNDN